jgi:hypothetical protein
MGTFLLLLVRFFFSFVVLFEMVIVLGYLVWEPLLELFLSCFYAYSLHGHPECINKHRYEMKIWCLKGNTLLLHPGGCSTVFPEKERRSIVTEPK